MPWHVARTCPVSLPTSSSSCIFIHVFIYVYTKLKDDDDDDEMENGDSKVVDSPSSSNPPFFLPLSLFINIYIYTFSSRVYSYRPECSTGDPYNIVFIAIFLRIVLLNRFILANRIIYLSPSNIL